MAPGDWGAIPDVMIEAPDVDTLDERITEIESAGAQH